MTIALGVRGLGVGAARWLASLGFGLLLEQFGAFLLLESGGAILQE